MKVVWRICELDDRKRAFDGEGARLYGGRWNFKGTALIYTAESPSLAILETLVHVEPALLKRPLFRFKVELPEGDVEKLAPALLPSTWRDHPPGDETRTLGTDWAAGRKSLALAVPSAVVAEEMNYLLNPAHPRFTKLVIGKPEALALDERLLRKKK
ncbi:MAG: RES family NAD+ phosphorylase [Treponema sp.]|nr:RES family NAD+ phosphorylase [Treponema sp.]